MRAMEGNRAKIVLEMELPERGRRGRYLWFLPVLVKPSVISARVYADLISARHYALSYLLPGVGRLCDKEGRRGERGQ